MKRKKLTLTLLSCVMALSMVMLTGCDVPPLANAGPAQTVNAGDTVTLDGSSSSDPDPRDPNPGPLTYSWTQTAGTSVALSGASTANPTFTAPDVDETLTFEMTVTDDEGNSETDKVDINVLTPCDSNEECITQYGSEYCCCCYGGQCGNVQACQDESECEARIDRYCYITPPTWVTTTIP